MYECLLSFVHRFANVCVSFIMYVQIYILKDRCWHIYVHVFVFIDIRVSWHACVLTNDGTNILNICVSQNACVCTICCANTSLGISVCVYMCQKLF